MSRLPAVDPIDLIAATGLALVALAAGTYLAWQAGIAVIGVALLAYAILATRSGGPTT